MQSRPFCGFAMDDLPCVCPGHAGVSGKERANRLASTADITSGVQLGRAEVLRGLRNFLNMDRPEHHSTDRPKERGVEKGSGRRSTLQGGERSVYNQKNTVSRATFERLLRCHIELKLVFAVTIAVVGALFAWSA